MEKENNSEKATLTYEEYRNIKKMLASSSEDDVNLAVGILENVDNKQSLPYVLFILMDLASRKFSVAPHNSTLWKLYTRLPICTALSKLVSARAISTQNPFNYTDHKKILDILDSRVWISNNKSYIHKIVSYITVNQVVDAIAAQHDTNQYIELQEDINQFIRNCLKNNDNSLLGIQGVELTFDLLDAIKKRKKNE